MRQSHLYFIAAALFLIAACLNTFNEGFNLKPALGLVVAGALLVLGFNMRKTGK